MDHSAQRVNWATVLQAPQLPDNTPITLFEFTKGNDNWQPLEEAPEAIDTVETSVRAIKRIVNGQVVILRDGKAFNVLGAEL